MALWELVFNKAQAKSNMNVTIQKQNKADDGSITFPGLHCWNPETEVITIAAQVSGRRVSCRVSYADIKNRFSEISDTPLLTAKKYRKEIEDVARTLIKSKSYEKDGSVMISYQDLMQ